MTTYLEKSCSFGLPRVPFVNCRQFMYLVISLLVLKAGCGICLYQFLIIAYHFTLTVQHEHALLQIMKNERSVLLYLSYFSHCSEFIAREPFSFKLIFQQ